jgi:hypothetical protein
MNNPNTDKIASAVQTFIEGENCGALMISGAWGSGKSYYVKNELVKTIRRIDYSNKDDIAISDKIYKLLENYDVLDQAKFIPVVISIFGLSSVSDIEKSISNKWIEVITHGVANKIDKIFSRTEKLLNRSKKLKDWFDFTGLLHYTPGVSLIPRNAVVIIDDLERFSGTIDESEILGFINELSENLGFKVILVANEEYLESTKYLSFKEKVVEKVLSFEPNTHFVAQSIISSFPNEDFRKFMLQESICDSLNTSSSFAKRYPKYKRSLTNLRTIKFAINHFYKVYCDLHAHYKDGKITQDELNELLFHSWFTILAIAIEFKSNKISSTDCRGIDKFFYLSSGEMLFGDDNDSLSDDTFDNTSSDSKESDKDKADKKSDNDNKYSRWFYEFYFKARGIGLRPIASKELLGYVISGNIISYEKLITDYNREKEALEPKTNIADVNLNKFMRGLHSMSNEDVVTNLKNLLVSTERGEFSELTSFINASTYLLGFQALLSGVTSEQINSILEKGVEIWLDNHELNDVMISRFNVIANMIEPTQKSFYDYIHQSITRRIGINETDEQQKLLELFNTDLNEFCCEICPILRGYQGNSIPVTHSMTSPILDKIDKAALPGILENITIAQVNSLTALLHERYNVVGLPQLFESEEIFWSNLKELIPKYTDQSTAGRILMDKTLLPAIIKALPNN